MEKLTTKILQTVIQPRPVDSYKGTFGKCLIIAGSRQFGGAALMATGAALYTGTGLVTLATDTDNLTSLRTIYPEAMGLDLNDPAAILTMVQNVDVVAFGPGLQGTDQMGDLLIQVATLLTSKQTLILDASAFGLIAQTKLNLKKIRAHLILTPHVMEWKKISHLLPSQQQFEHNQATLDQLTLPQTALILKGAPSHIYFSGSQQIFENTAGTPAMATGGMGDTLTGIMSGFVAQFNWSPTTVLAATFAHSYLAEQLAKKQYVVLPTHLIQALPQFMKLWQ